MPKDTIKKLRTEQGLSQDELAERVHVVRQTVSKWKRGTSVPDADSLVALARALGVSAAELLGGDAMAEKKPGTTLRGRPLFLMSALPVSRNGSIAGARPQMGARRRGGYGACLRSFYLAAKRAVLLHDMVGQRDRRSGLQ